MRGNFFYSHKYFKHYKVKFFSLLSALILWFLVVSDQYYDHTLNVSLRLVNKPEGMILKQPVPYKVKVRFRGSGKNLLSLRYRNKYIDLDLEKVKRTAQFPITTDMVKGIPVDMAVTPLWIVEPDSVMISLDRFAEKRVPLLSDITLIPLDGYIQVGDIVLDPDSVVVRGPESFVRTVSEIYTEQKVYRNVIKEIHGRVDLVPIQWEMVSYSLNTVQFRADIQRIGERVIKEIPIQVTHVPNGMKVTVVPSTLSLQIQGGVSILSKIEKKDIAAVIDYRSRYRYRKKRIPATIQVPKDISFSDVKPQFFELIIER
jgi:YbbR domain-containing protein